MHHNSLTIRKIYFANTIFFNFLAIPSCPAKIEGLVHYPTTLAPVNGSVTVTTLCADNAHIRSGSSLNITCASNGSWLGLDTLCQHNFENNRHAKE